MKKRRVITTLLMSLFCLSLLSLSLAQSVTLVKKGEPFPYATGAAFDQVAYEAVKTRILAAEELIRIAGRAVDSLKKEVALQDGLLATKTQAIDQVRSNYNVLHEQYISSLDSVRRLTLFYQEAQPLIASVRSSLPRKVRNQSPSLTSLTLAFQERQNRLRWRPLRWGVGGAVLGIVGSSVHF